jgi:hypothetical protein
MRNLKTVYFLAIIVCAFMLGGITFTYVFYWMSFDTEYPVGFVSKSWDKVTIGMKETEAVKLSGEPLSIVQWSDHETKTLNYSKSASNNANYIHYYLDIRDGTVIRKEKEIFWD